MIELTRKHKVGALVIAAAGFLLNEAFGWGVSALLDLVASRLTWEYLISVRWGGVIGIALLILGLVIFFFPAKKAVADAPVPSATNPRKLIVAADQFMGRLGVHEKNRLYIDDPAADLYDVTQMGGAVMMSFEKDGFSVPILPADLNERAKAQLIYFKSIVPILREGHLAEAREYSAEVCNDIEAQNAPE